MCLLGRFLRCLVDVGSVGGILKSAFSNFLYRGVNSAFKVGVGSISVSTGVLLEERLKVVLGFSDMCT